MCHRSMPGSPSRIQFAITSPIPPAPAMPWAQNPAATKKPATSVSPKQNSLSGVNASGPLIIDATPTSASTGTRTWALTRISPNRSQSGGRSLPLKSAGGTWLGHAAADSRS